MLIPTEPARATVMPASRMKDLKPRIVSALVMAVAVLAATWAGGWVFRAMWAIVGGLVAHEWLSMTRQPRPVTVAAGLVVIALGISAPLLPGPWLAGLILACCVGFLLFGTGRIIAAAGFAYAAVIALAPALLRDVAQLGPWLILWSFAVVWFSDSAAYFTGRALGGPKLMPSVSPKKTWSGAAGGLAAGVAGGVAVALAARNFGITLPMGLISVALVSLVATMLGQAGDLAESALKRHCDVKDSSHIIPGHGGFMDRLDAYWPVIVLAAVLVLAAR